MQPDQHLPPERVHSSDVDVPPTPSGSLTVVIPAYNAATVVDRAITSAWASGAREVIVVDDGSSDETASVARMHGALCLEQVNTGAFVARERGAEVACSDYLIFLDSDDELIPEGVHRSLQMLEADPTLGVCAGTVIGVGTARQRAFPVRYSPVNVTSLLQRGFGPWPPAAAVLRRTAYVAAVGMPLPALAPRFADDYELLIRLSMVSRVSVHSSPAARYSMFGGKSAKSARAAIQAKENIRAYYARHLSVPVALMTETAISRAAFARIARGQIASGQRLRALWTMAKWTVADPRASVSKLLSAPWKRN